MPEPPFTRFLVHEMSSDHYFNIAAAKRELQFKPQLTVREALERTFAIESANHLKASGE